MFSYVIAKHIIRYPKVFDNLCNIGKTKYTTIYFYKNIFNLHDNVLRI